MGQWHLSVEGHGVHHNFLEDKDRRLVKGEDGKYIHRLPEDADKMFEDFVESLRKAGHHIAHATITVGSTQEV